MKSIRVRGKNLTRSSVKLDMFDSPNWEAIQASCFVLCEKLELPTFEGLANYRGKVSAMASSTISAKFEEDPDAVLDTFLEKAIGILEGPIQHFDYVFMKTANTKWLADYEGVFEIIIPNLIKVIEEGENTAAALIELFTLYYFYEERAGLVQLAPWYIRYASQEAITEDTLLNKLCNVFHDEYIVRLPANELFEFLTSEKEQARIKAKNKVAMDLIGELDED